MLINIYVCMVIAMWGNILWRDDAPSFYRFFDDAAKWRPAIQDVWMLLSGDRERQNGHS